ncbi:phosphonate C-P lyase system protein PhnH [Rhodococcus gannanensis]|uniref:Phosphonate C-P lyase system protein PhnH n=1 Tax=Rhodococcus gannanensis TaxID=1960308 RepID=A0ABW4P1T1_9NOCA
MITDTAAVRGAALDAVAAQRVYRSALEALSRPGTVHPLPPSGYPAALLPVLALADLDTGTHLVDLPGDAWEPIVEVATGAPVVEVHAARYVTVLDPAAAADAVAHAHPGSAASPESGATVVIAVESVVGGDPVLLTGPGVAGELLFAPRGVDPAIWTIREGRVADFPAGIDLLFVDPDGGIVGVPRTTTATTTTR